MDDSVLINCFFYLDHISLQSVAIVNHNWKILSESHVIWKILIVRLWYGKVFIPLHSRLLLQISPKAAFLTSVEDSKRTYLTDDELCEFTWSFRFKETAGDDWMQICPWQRGDEASQVKFHGDRTVQRLPHSSPSMALMNEMYAGVQLHWKLKGISKMMKSQQSRSKNMLMVHKKQFDDLDLKVGSGTSYLSHCIGGEVPTTSPLLSRSTHVDDFSSLKSLKRGADAVGTSRSSPIPKLIRQSVDTETKESNVEISPKQLFDALVHMPIRGKIGSQVSLQVNGVAVPTYQILRSSTGNWGFMLESCWAVYTSWAMPRKGTCDALEDEALQVNVDNQWREVQRYNNSIGGFDLEDDIDEGD